MKQATATKLRICSTYSPRSSIHFYTQYTSYSDQTRDLFNILPTELNTLLHTIHKLQRPNSGFVQHTPHEARYTSTHNTQATVAKLGICSTYSPRSSIHFYTQYTSYSDQTRDLFNILPMKLDTLLHTIHKLQ